jgi:DNA-binding beta-propeller fold protein YncE
VSPGLAGAEPAPRRGGRQLAEAIFVDRANGDVYVSDGEGSGTNRRIVVLDRTGRFLRHWVIEDMENVHCMTLANDGMVYVCNRMGSEVRVYDRMGKRQRSIPVPWTPVTPAKDGVVKQSGGSAVAVDFSPDPGQRLMFVINQNSSQIEIIERATGKNLGSFGRPGSFPDQFNQVHGIAVDSKGNVYLDENRGRRVHKFRPLAQ